jgi:hypothetical protein
MHTLGIVLIVIGIFYSYMILLRPPWVVNNIKVRVMIKWWGVKGFWIFFICWTALFLILGTIFVSIY